MDMREEFEHEWRKVSGRDPVRSIALDGQNSYENRIDDAAWWAWQRSRSIIVIELPETCRVNDDDDLFHPNIHSRWLAIDQVHEAIEAIGLTVKP